ncbi:ATP-binding protein [Actinokineospora enzanensis]|uniref:ATP-binding protein n=1 Tax=Actinokineospora enzanensis TaxID=155975 RepID=UPI00035CCA3B|nr:ATP-binding protein [Actinokineospora enzanensis]
MVELGTPLRWWSSVSERGRYVHMVVVGPRKSGKSAFFERLAERGDVILWDVRRVARAQSTRAVWADLFAALGIDAAGERPIEDLEDHLDTLARGPVLVVDHWDEAVDGRERQVPDHCYEVLDELSRFCLGQAMTRPAGEACLGIALLTSLPAPSDLEFFTRAVHRTTFERLSKLITRLFVTEPFPALDKEDGERLLVAEGVPAASAGEVADACGGWLWLLLEAADAVRDHGAWTAGAVEQVRDRRLPALLDASVVKWLVERPQVVGPPMDYLAQELAAGRLPAELGVPHAFDDPRRAAPLIRQLLTKTFLVVDTENIWAPFHRHAEVEPERYPDGVEKSVGAWVGEWVRRLCKYHDVAVEDVWLIGRSPGKIDAIVGPDTPGERFGLSKPLKDKAKGRDGSDDNLLTAKVTQQAVRNPFASFVLATEDGDSSHVLEIIGLLDQVVVCTPWRSSKRLRELMADPARLREFTFPKGRPREVSNAEIDAARARRAGRA